MIVVRHYRELVLQAEVETWFGIEPAADGLFLYLRSVASGHLSACERVWQLAQRTMRLAGEWSLASHQGMM